MSLSVKEKFAEFGNFVDEVLPARRAPAHTAWRENGKFIEGTAQHKLGLHFGARFWFLLIVVLPTVLALTYYGFIASPMYVSEAQFVVRHPAGATSESGAGGLKSLLTQGTTDVDIVRDYMMSRDVVRRLEKQDDLRAILNRPGTDFLSRFPLLPGWNSFEQLFNAYLKMVDIEINEDSGVLTLDVRAVNPDDATRVASSLVGYAEQLVNEMNQRAEHDTLAIARKEVDRAEHRVIAAQAALTQFRNRQAMLYPNESGKALLQLTGQLLSDMATTNAEIFRLEKSTPKSPQLSALRLHVRALQAQIAKTTDNMVGGETSIAPKLADYEQLDLQSTLADKELSSALQDMDIARVNSMRQQVYLERLAQPNLPDYPLYPKIIKMVSLVFLISFMIFGLGWILVASAREHLAS